MRYSNRLFLYAPFAVLLIIAAAAMLRWREVADQWQTKLLAANRGEEIAPGVTLHFTSEEIGGFPFNLDIVLDKFVLAVRSTRGPISLESERFAIHALTYGRTQQVMESAGLQILIWTDAEGGAFHRVDQEAAGTVALALVQRRIRVAKQAIRAGRVVRVHADADGGRHVELGSVQDERSAQAFVDADRDGLGHHALSLGHPRERRRGECHR